MEKRKQTLCNNVRTSEEVKYDVTGHVNQQVFMKHVSFYICIHSIQTATSKTFFPFSIEPASKQSSQHNYKHQNENNAQNKQTEIDCSSDSESECSDTNETPPQNENSIHVDMTSHQLTTKTHIVSSHQREKQ